MKEFVGRAIRNTPAMNTLMFSVLAIGLLSLWNLRREVFPEFELEIILVTVPYPGASPEEVEEGICQKMEEAVRSIDGIKKQTAVAKEGAGMLVLELETSVDVQRVLGEVRSEIDRIPSFPLLAEDPEVKQITLRQPAIQVGVIGPASLDSDDDAGAGDAGAGDPAAEVRLRDIAEQVRDELILLPSVSQANILGAKNYQIDVEIAESTLRRYGLSLQQVARIIRRENLELPGGTIRTEAQDVLVKGENKGQIGPEIARIPLITQPNGVVLTVGDLGTVRDEFADVQSWTRVDGRPAMVVSVDRTSNEDLLAITDEVADYVREKSLPPGYSLLTWGDRSIEVRDRMNLLVKNGLSGLLLVLLLLAVFLNLRLAFWVSVGIPISILGACAVLWYAGQTLNMLTMFSFLMALGIVVDDAIVIGENIYTRHQQGLSWRDAAVDGTVEVLPSVMAAVATTIIAFVPLMFVTGIMGKFIAVMPLTMIAILLMSLFESTFVLPCHLAHDSHEKPNLFGRAMSALRAPFRPIGRLFDWLNAGSDRMLQRVTRRAYVPLLRRSLHQPGTTLSVAVVLLLLAVALVTGGIVPFVIFPKLDSNTIQANITFPDGTPARVTNDAARRIEAAFRQIHDEHDERGDPVLKLLRRSVGHRVAAEGPGPEGESSGSHLGSVTAELVDTSQRNISSQELISQWRDRVGEIAGVEGLTFGSAMQGPGGAPIEFKLLARGDQVADLEAAVEECKARLNETPGVFDVSDDSRPGKWEFRVKIHEDAVAMGVPLVELAETVRAAYYGEEVMRLQRGRHEVKLMVRYPREDRRSLAEFEQIRVRAEDGAERPLTELADVRVARGYSEINRVDQLRSITISADVDEALGNASQIVANLRADFMEDLLTRHPGVSVRWEGQQEQTIESMRSLMIGFAIAMVAMFVLLTLQFTSYFQPLLIMAIIPFGLVGAVAGHAVLGLPVTMFSMFGLVALSGVVVNDSIVLIDFINERTRGGMPLHEALIDAGQRRLRPIFLTSITTIAGLLPLLLERSLQAQVLIPMAVSLCFGLALTTVLVLLLIPTLYLLCARALGVGGGYDARAEESVESASGAGLGLRSVAGELAH
jgi:HAE1 family hydrophobic/amphiphilic exporter-1